jgi:TRAP-type C4-dicarboxylate transport system substrate-binding protein
VDGQENAIPTIIIGAVYEVQKYLVLDRHVYTQIHLFVNDEWFNGLPKEYQEIILRAGEKAGYIGQRSTRVYRDIGEKFLSNHMEIYHPTMEEKQMFRDKVQQPVSKFIRKAVDDEKWVDGVLEAAKAANKKLGYTK